MLFGFWPSFSEAWLVAAAVVVVVMVAGAGFENCFVGEGAEVLMSRALSGEVCEDIFPFLSLLFAGWGTLR